MRSRLLIIAIAILAVIGIGLAVFQYVRTPSGANEIPVSDETLPVVAVNTNGITYTTPRGTVTTKDFYANAIASTTYTVTLFDDPETGAIFIEPVTKSINIEVYANDLADLRTGRPFLEQKVLELLGVSQNDACKLPIFLSAYAPGVESIEGATLGLSFCPNAIPTP